MDTRSVTYAVTCTAALVLSACGGGSTDAQFASGGLKVAAAPQAEAANLVVRARASLAGNVGAQMELRVNGVLVADAEVRETSYQNYSFTVPPIQQGNKVDVVFTNDATVSGQDRNLFVESITVNGGIAIAATEQGVTLDKGVGAKAFDGLDVLPGQRSLLWNGALRFTVGSSNGAGSTLSPACEKFYAAAPGFALNADRVVASPSALPKPAKGAAFAEPNFKTCVTRATDHTADGLAGYARTEYSRRQMFNADNTLQLIVARDGYFYLYDANTHAMVKKLPSFGVDPEMQWHPTDPKQLYLMPHQGGELQQKVMNVATGEIRVVGDFRTRLKALFPNATPTHAYTKAEGSPSKDGRYWCYMVRDSVNSVGGNWGSVGVFTWDRDTDTVLGSMKLNGEVPDHVSMSPSGSHCVVSSDGSIGTAAYSRDFSQKRSLLSRSVHSDLAIDANGEDVLVYIDSTNYGDVYMTRLSNGERTQLMSGIRSAAHFSGKAFLKPGWVALTTQATWEDGAGKQWMQNKVMAVQLKANPTVYNLAFHRTAYNGEATAPTASVNRDFTRIAFNSNWEVKSQTDVDTYNIEIPANALKESGTPTPTPTPTPTALSVVLGSVKRDTYLVTYQATTSVPAKCGSAWVQGQPFAYLYDFLTASADGLKHGAAVYLDSPTAAKTIYLVCRANGGSAEKEVVVQVN
ncbi:MAG: hypothetical protein EON54_06420 [Alcaligenaceae bacterium]|nr:MAG: hypothetical protein EON54_06420 [Alcaligenaceae bacterium]